MPPRGRSRVAAVSHADAGEDDRDGVAALDRPQQRRDPRPAQTGRNDHADDGDPPRRHLLPVQDPRRKGKGAGHGGWDEFGSVAVADSAEQRGPVDQVGPVVGDQQQRLRGVAAAQPAAGPAGAPVHRPTSSHQLGFEVVLAVLGGQLVGQVLQRVGLVVAGGGQGRPRGGEQVGVAQPRSRRVRGRAGG